MPLSQSSHFINKRTNQLPTINNPNTRRAVMIKRVFVSLFLCTLVVSIGFGGADKAPKKFIMDEGTGVPSPVRGGGDPVVEGGLSWVLVDSMNNCYGMLSNVVEPLVYDPTSMTLGLVHRANTAYGMASGELWYNTSHDGGATWARITALNAGAPTLSRYPSSTISSPSGLFCFSAPQLNPAAFGYLIYGVDIIDAGAPFAVEEIDANNYWSNTRIEAATDNPYIWWLTRTTGGYFHVWRTMDYVTVDESEPWAATDFSALGQDAGLVYRNGMLYFGVFSTFPGDPGIVFNVAYSASADMGTTWSAWNGPNIGSGDWRTLPGISGTIYTDWHSGNSFDMVVDANGYVHFFGILVDDFTTPTMLAVAEIYETGSGWAANIIAEGLSSTTRTDYNAVDQMGYHVNSAISTDGMAMSVNWLSAPAEGDTLPDIFGSVRHLNNSSWSPAANYTNTPDFAELLVQAAPVLRSDGGDNYTLFLSRSYQCGVTTYPPNDLTCTYIFVAAQSLTITSTGVDEGSGVPSEYRLAQNYPNPFNPGTVIEYSIPKSSFVTLKVYDVLGREIATLVNGEQTAGSYTTQFDATNLANGTYLYKLQAGSYTETKKMVVLK